MSHRGSVDQRRAVVTGGARGIGFAVAHRLLEEGARVVIADIDQLALAEARNRLASFSRQQLAMCQCDISDASGVKALTEFVKTEFGGIDILINNAGILDWGAIESLLTIRLEEVLRVNLIGAITCIKEMLPELSRSSYGRIVNIASINGLRGTPSSIAYNASKAALINLTRSLAVDLAERGILVNAVAPGFVNTRMSKLADGSSEYETDWFQEVYIKHGRIPLRRPALPEDIAGPVVFLCSKDASYITGHVLVVDGGVTATF
jgi:NAD(P)-dependent dehydrogenase (short-subunit alcohol dehydrogenase family)